MSKIPNPDYFIRLPIVSSKRLKSGKVKSQWLYKNKKTGKRFWF